MLPRERNSSAGSAPRLSAPARAAQPASVIWVWSRLSFVSLASPPVVGGGRCAAAYDGRAGEALVAERVAIESEKLQRGHPPQGRREGQQPCVTDGGAE